DIEEQGVQATLPPALPGGRGGITTEGIEAIRSTERGNVRRKRRRRSARDARLPLVGLAVLIAVAAGISAFSGNLTVQVAAGVVAVVLVLLLGLYLLLMFGRDEGVP